MWLFIGPIGVVQLLLTLKIVESQKIPTSSWGNGDFSNPASRSDKFLQWLIFGCSEEVNCRPSEYRHVEYEGYDGFYNNIAKPNQGGIDTPLLRLLQPVYADGVYSPVKRKTNPIDISRNLMNGTNGRTSRVGNTAFLLFFGQQVVEEILDAQGAACPPEYFNIDVPHDHEYQTEFPKLKVLPFLRTRYDMRTGFSPNNPRQQLNEITPYIDGGLVYGAAKGWADALRVNKDNTVATDGQLAWHSELGPGFPAENSQRLPMANPPPPANHSQFVHDGFTANVNRFFKLGNPRGNENPFLLTFGIFWFRWHNVIAVFLKKKYPEWDGERIFNEARKWVIATQQAVTVYDWLQKYLKTNIKPYSESINLNGGNREIGGYDPTVDPQISHIFQSAAMRFGHTLVPSGVYLRAKNSEGCGTTPLNLDPSATSHTSRGVRTCNSFWRSPELFKKDQRNFERFLLGMSSQSTEEEDNIIVEDLRGRVFGPLEFSRRDLMAVNIQRARDHGLPDYNTARKHFGLDPLYTLDPIVYSRITKTKVPIQVLEKLQAVYNNTPDDVDIWPGGLLETSDGPGQLFNAVILDQFERIRAGDRFWFENKKNKLFTPDAIDRIKLVKIIDIVLSVADINLEDIQEDPFTAPRTNNLPTGANCSLYLDHHRSCKIYSIDQKNWATNLTCMYLQPLGNTNLENCTDPKSYDYFSGSSLSFILTFLITGISCLALFLGVNIWTITLKKKKSRRHLATIHVPEGHLRCKERVSFFERRIVIISFDEVYHRVIVKSTNGIILRAIELYGQEHIHIMHTENYERFILRAANHYDLYCICENSFYSANFLKLLYQFCQEIGQHVEEVLKSRMELDREVVTVKYREQQLAQFMAYVLENKTATKNIAKPLRLKTQLTYAELADALAMSEDSIFVSQLFSLMDTDQSGFITAQEFASVMLKLSKGTLDEKAEILFYIYDLDHSGTISGQDFKMLIESTLGGDIQGQDIDKYITTMLAIMGLNPGDSMTFSQFKDLFLANEQLGNAITVNLKEETAEKGSRFSRFSIYGDHSIANQMSNHGEYPEEETLRDAEEENIGEEETHNKGPIEVAYFRIINYFRINEKILFWRTLYTLVMFLIFAERAYYYSVEREHAGLRRIAGYGVTVTRGAASAMMFTFSSLLITMCRNLLSALRSSFLNWYYPFDDMVEMHKYIGWWALFWSLVHIIGHAINFYHVSTQTPSDLSCLFRNYFRSTHVLPKFHYWCWETVTGLTGVALTLQVAIIYVFAANARRHLFRLFWITHNTYPLFYLLNILHGSGQLVQAPFFHLFFLGPCILFTIDKIISISRKSVKIVVVKSVHLPSNVTLLYIQRPLNFSYLSGQWVRIASLGISTQEFHPFTLSSAPHEKFLTLHIRGVGLWTNQLRKVYPDHLTIKADPDFRYPLIYLDGPFGEGHQNWCNYEIAILVGGGIGVTPFASILKDIVFKCKQPSTSFRCKKVIFLWVTRSQRQFEWMIDMLTQVEEADTRNIIRIHIFITQFKTKYDLRTFMLYHAERRFQKVHGKSLFTGLRALTHFSRPNFYNVFKSIKARYAEAPVIGVFTCGAPSLSQAVEDGCREANALRGPILQHFYENF